MINRIHELAANRNQWILAVFVCYVALVFILGLIYYLIYQNNRRAFAFNSDIVRAQSGAVEQASLGRLGQLASELSLLHQLKKELAATGSEPTVGLEFGGLFIASTIRGSKSQFTVTWPKARGAFPGGGPPPPTNLRVISLQGGPGVKIIGDSSYDLPESTAAFRALADRWIADWETKQRVTRAVQDSLATDSPDVWSYWDFLYFSAITQFTVGCGDILPNATSVRMVVILQTCMAAGLLVVVINVAFATRQ